MGLTEELATKVMTALSGNYIPRNRYNEISKENENLKAAAKEHEKQLETLKGSAGENETLKQQIADLQTANNTAKENFESEMNKMKVDFAVEKALTSAKAKNIKAVMALLDLTVAKRKMSHPLYHLIRCLSRIGKKKPP